MTKAKLILLTGFSCFLFGNFACNKNRSAPDPNVLNLMSPAPIGGLDPAQARDVYSVQEIASTYETLLTYQPDQDLPQLLPLLADGMPRVSRDGKFYTFKIKKGVLFHDDLCFRQTQGKGRELVAEDFVYTFKRIADPHVQASAWSLLEGRFVGLDQWREEAEKKGRADYAKEVPGVRAIGRYELQFELTSPNESFLHHLSMAFAAVVAREAVQYYGENFAANPVGTGPFLLNRDESNLESTLVWQRNPTFRREGDSDQRIPGVNQIVVRVIPDDQKRWREFTEGRLDLVPIPRVYFEDAVTPAKRLSDHLSKKGVNLHQDSSLDITHISFNFSDPLLGGNRKLRQAMSLAYNIEPVIDLFYKGRAVAAQGPIPPGLKEYDPKLINPYRQFNLSKARRLLAEAGFPNGKGLKELEFVTDDSDSGAQFAKYFKRSMAEIGIEIAIKQVEWSELIRLVKEKKAQIFSYTWLADYPDSENFMQLFYGGHASPGPNDANYANPEFDELYEKLLSTPGEERSVLYRKMVNILVEDVPWIFGVHRMRFRVSQPWLKNFHAKDLGQLWRRHLTVDLTQKKNWMGDTGKNRL